MQGFTNGIDSQMNEVGNIMSKAVLYVEEAFANRLGKITTYLYPIITGINISRFATGGFSEDGLFFKNSDEIIMQVSGKPQVLNSNDTYDIIKQAAYEGQIQANSELVRYLTGIEENTRRTAEKDTSISIDGREIVTAYDSRKARIDS